MIPIGHGKIRGPLLHASHHPEELCGALLDAAQHPKEPSTMDSLDLLKALSGMLLLIGMNYSPIRGALCSHHFECRSNNNHVTSGIQISFVDRARYGVQFLHRIARREIDHSIRQALLG